MQVKRFVAADMRRALELVRSDLGADAIILSNRRVKEGVEILTTVEGGFDQKTDSVKEKENLEWQDSTVMHSDEVLGIADKQRQGQPSRAPGVAMENPPISNGSRLLPEADLPLPDSLKSSLPAASPSTARSFSGGIPNHLQEEIALAREKMFMAKRMEEAGEGALAPKPPSEMRRQEADLVAAPKTNRTPVADHTPRSPTPRAPTPRAPTQETPAAAKSSPAGGNVNPQIGSALMDLIVQGSKEDERQMSPATYADVESVSETQLQSQAEAQQNKEELADVKAELRSMRGLLQQQLDSATWGQFSSSSPTQAALWQKYHQMGLSPSIIKRLIHRVNATDNFADAWKSSLALLANDLGCIDGDVIKKGGVFAFVGPTGVGKTTTIGKLAARYVLKNGSDSIALVTTDNYRIAAHEQLKAFANILDIPLKVAQHPSELPAILDSFSDKSLVLVDTAGLNSQNQNLDEQLLELKRLEKRVKTLMVLSTTAQRSVMKTAISAYGKAGLKACVLTKLDEVTSLGESFSAVIEGRLPIAYFTDGQTIPDDVHIVKPKKLINRAIALAKEHTADPENVTSSFMSVMKATRQGTEIAH